MVTYKDISIFNPGEAPHLGSIFRINRGDTITNVKFSFARLEKSYNSFGNEVKSETGRKVKAAIWIVKDGWNITKDPNFVSTQSFDTNDIIITPSTMKDFHDDEYGPNNIITQLASFSFNDAKNIMAEQVVVGLIVDPQSTSTSTTLAYVKQPGLTLYYQWNTSHDTEDYQTTNANGLSMKVTTEAYPESENVKLNITDINYRTLSDNSSNNPHQDLADIPSLLKNMWNRNSENNKGYTFQEGYLKDVELASLENPVNTNPDNPYWVFNRSQIKFTFDDDNKGITSLQFSIQGENPTNKISTLNRERGKTTLLICPAAHNIQDNSAFSITFTRTLKNTNNADIATTSKTVYFHTYATPQVEIAFPKIFKRESNNNALIEESNKWPNYVLWANDVINFEVDSRYAGMQICDVLDLLLTKDGGDDSKLPMFTRIYIAEYPMIDMDRDMVYLENSNILQGKDLQGENKYPPLREWTGIKLDDGTLMQLSGMRVGGYTWRINKNYNNYNYNYREVIENQFKDKGISPKDLKTIVDQQIDDQRLYFRANYRYLVKVRRFHSMAAGVLSNNSYNNWKYPSDGGGVGSGGNYTYNNPEYPGYYSGSDATNSYPNYNLPTPGFNSINSIPNIDTSVISNMVEAENSRNISEENKRWCGPEDGTFGVNSENVYPGFSKSDYIIIDCVNASLGSKNIITTRPASQEINANSFITFAYRHIQKGLPSIEEIGIDRNNCKKPNPNSISADGSSTGWQTYPGKDYPTWGGFDNVWKRIYNTYKYIAETAQKVAQDLKKEKDDELSSKLDSYTSDPLELNLKLKLHGLNNGGTDGIIMLIRYDEATRTHKLHELLSGKWDSNYENILIYLDRNNHPMIGNQYMWVPIINAASDSNTYYTISTTSPNTAPPIADNTKKPAHNVDTSHYFKDQNAFQQDNYNSDENKIHGILENPGEMKKNTEGINKLVNFDLSVSKAGSDTLEGAQYFNNPGNSEIGTDLGIYNNIAPQGYQNKPPNPGNLYKRVPLKQDCECGEITTNRLISPLNPVLYPLVRVSHMLYFQSYISGDFDITCEFTYHYTTTTGTPPETKPHTEVCNLTDIDSSFKAAIQHLYLHNEVNTNIIPLYKEDNNGRGRLLSADDDTSLWYRPTTEDNKNYIAYSNWGYEINQDPNESSPKTIPGDGAIEIPIRVRYTPLMQPALTLDKAILGNLPENTTTKTNNALTLISKCSGSDKTLSVFSGDSSLLGASSFYANFTYGMFNSVFSGRYLSTDYVDQDSRTHSEYQNLLQQSSSPTEPPPTKPPEDIRTISTDTYPAVGICNCYLVLLFPNAINFDYSHQVSNFYSNRNNYINLSDPYNNGAKPVIVADLAFNPEESCNFDKIENANTIQLDNQYRTIFSCEFDFNKLFRTGGLATNSSNDADSSPNRLKSGTWYDLIVVPIYSNHAHHKEDAATYFNYDEKDAGTINGYTYGGGTSDIYNDDEKNKIDYYGSSPLVIRKYLKIADIIDDSSSCNPAPDPEKPEEDISRWLSPAIIFPNVNNTRYNQKTGLIKECPGFWLNNSFRLIIRGPHFRTAKEIANNPSTDPYEVSIESASRGKLKNSKDFVISDIQIHFGDYNKPITSPDNPNTIITFSSEEYQRLINNNSSNKSWLNSHNIFSMSFNPEAFSKCTPASKANGDKKDLIKGGILGKDIMNLAETNYIDRFFEVNPKILGIKADSKEGYHIQFRYLNAEYGDTSEGGEWSAWYGGLVDDVVVDSAREYCVPARNYNEILTDYMAFIKESYPGSALTQYIQKTKESELREIVMSSSVQSMITGEGNLENTKRVSESDLDLPYFPQIYDERTATHDNYNYYQDRYTPYSENLTAAAKEKINLKRYLEMSYIDYIAHNMAKLYYSTFDGAYIIGDNNNLKPKDLGWTRSYAYAYKDKLLGYEDPVKNISRNPYINSEWDTENAELTNLNSTNPNNWGEKVDLTSGNLGEVGKPANRNRYFRKTVTQNDFDELLETLQNMMKFIRSTKFTGKHLTSSENIAIKNNQKFYFSGNESTMDILLYGKQTTVGSGLSVLPISPEALEFIRNSKYFPPYNITPYNNGVRNVNGMIIGNNSSLYNPGYTYYNEDEQGIKIYNETYNSVVSNYMQQLLNTILSKVIT